MAMHHHHRSPTSVNAWRRTVNHPRSWSRRDELGEDPSSTPLPRANAVAISGRFAPAGAGVLSAPLLTRVYVAALGTYHIGVAHPTGMTLQQAVTRQTTGRNLSHRALLLRRGAFWFHRVLVRAPRALLVGDPEIRRTPGARWSYAPDAARIPGKMTPAGPFSRKS